MGSLDFFSTAELIPIWSANDIAIILPMIFTTSYIGVLGDYNKYVHIS